MGTCPGIELVNFQGQTIDRSQFMAFTALKDEFCFKVQAGGGPVPPLNICEEAGDVGASAKALQATVDDYSYYQQDMYLGIGGKVAEIPDAHALDLWEEDRVPLTLLYSTSPPQESTLERGIWESGNRLIYAGRQLDVDITEGPTTIGQGSAFFFIQNNAMDQLFNAYVSSQLFLARYEWDDQSRLETVSIVFLVLEAVFLLTVIHMYQLRLVVAIERARLGAVLAITGLPGAILHVMSRKPVTILEDDSDQDDEDDEVIEGPSKQDRKSSEDMDAQARREVEEMGQAPKKKAAESDLVYHENASHYAGDDDEVESTGVVSRLRAMGRRLAAPVTLKGQRNMFELGRAVRYNGKALVPSWTKVFKLTLPFFLWQLAVLIVYAVTVALVSELSGPLVSTVLAKNLSFRFSHVMATMTTLISQTTDAGKDEWKGRLVSQMDKLLSEYDALMFGGTASTQEGTPFDFPAPAASFVSPEFSRNFFQDQQCFRADQSTCLDESSPYYEASRSGLDTMLRRTLKELRLLTEDSNADVNYLSARVDFVQQVGAQDLYSGLRSSGELFVDYSYSKVKVIEDLHIALLIVTVVLALGYVFFVLRPYLRMLKHELSHVVGLLSHTPKELDIMRHLTGALKSTQ